jgi:hypothetical protein
MTRHPLVGTTRTRGVLTGYFYPGPVVAGRAEGAQMTDTTDATVQPHFGELLDGLRATFATGVTPPARVAGPAARRLAAVSRRTRVRAGRGDPTRSRTARRRGVRCRHRAFTCTHQAHAEALRALGATAPRVGRRVELPRHGAGHQRATRRRTGDLAVELPRATPRRAARCGARRGQLRGRQAVGTRTLHLRRHRPASPELSRPRSGRRGRGRRGGDHRALWNNASTTSSSRAPPVWARS